MKLKPALLVVTITCADRPADLATWGPRAVDVGVSCAFTHGLHDFRKVRSRSNSLTVGSNYIGSGDRARHCAGQGVRARRWVWKAGRRTACIASSGTTEKYHDAAG